MADAFGFGGSSTVKEFISARCLVVARFNTGGCLRGFIANSTKEVTLFKSLSERIGSASILGARCLPRQSRQQLSILLIYAEKLHRAPLVLDTAASAATSME